MDIPTDSDCSEDDTRSTSRNIDVKNEPVHVTWRGTSGNTESLAELQFGLAYRANTHSALIKLQTSTKLKKGPGKPAIFLFIDPKEIQSLEYLGDDEDGLDGFEHEQAGLARDKLNTSTHALRFTLRGRPTFVVPAEHPFQFFRAGSQVVWKSWEGFAREASQFTVHFPAKAVRQAPLRAFCRAASTRELLTPLDDNIASLYGGKGGRVIDLHTTESDDCIVVAEAPAVASLDESDAPPAYEKDAAESSISAVAPPLCLSPGPESRKRRRQSSSLSPDQKVDTRHDADCAGAGNILQIILELKKTVDAGRTAQDAALAKILAKVDTIESRLGQLEAQQRDLLQEVETQVEAQVEPLWDELSARLQSQEDREHDYIRDMIEESFEEKIDDKIPEAIDQYLKSNEDGQALAAEVVNERIREETRAFLRSQQFIGHFTIPDDK